MAGVVELCSCYGKIEILQNHGNQLQGTCPRCGDKRGKFYISLNKNGIFCHHCNLKGNMVTLLSECFGNTYSDDKEGFVNFLKDVTELSTKGAATWDNISKKRFLQQDINIETIERKQDSYCSKVYYSMLSMLDLREEHYNDLKRRGLSDEDIKRFRFRSTPQNPKEIVKKLLAQGFDLEGIPGFYTDKYKNWSMSLPCQGYFCPVFDGEQNLIMGFQIRVDSPVNGAKYIWFSSSNKEKGVSSGSLTTCLPGKQTGPIIITEGILKATVIYCLLKKEITVLGVPGVNAIKGLKTYLDRYAGMSYAFEAYDMDAETNEKVLKAKEDLITLIQSFDIDVHSLNWDTKDGKWNGTYKGLDDFLYEYGNISTFLNFLIGKASKALAFKKFLTA